MNIAYLQGVATDRRGTGGIVHVSQVADNLLRRGHTLYTNLSTEGDPRFIKLGHNGDFFRHGHEIDVFYIRIDGSPNNDERTLLRRANRDAVCIWEINAPVEEMRIRGASPEKVGSYHKRRQVLAQMVDGAICVSSEMESYARQELGIRHTTVIPNGSDPDHFRPAKRDDSLFAQHKFTVLWSGSSQYAWQGLKIIEQAAEKMLSQDPEVHFLVTAEGKNTQNLTYLGRVPYCDMPTIMASADVGCCIYEPITFYPHFFFSPLKLYDYMASGLPIIGSRVGQIEEVIERHHNGILCDATIDDIIDKIAYLKRNPEDRKVMAERGREAVVRARNWNQIAEDTERFIAEVIAHPTVSPYRSQFKGLNGWKWTVQHHLCYVWWPHLKGILAYFIQR